MWKFILWLLSLFGYKAEVAGVEAYQNEKQHETDEQVQEVQAHEQKITEQAEADKSGVDGLSEQQLDSKLRQ